MNDEKKIEAFFEKLRLENEGLSVPGFEEVKRFGNRPHNSRLRLGFAASLLILFGIFTFKMNQKETLDSSFNESSSLSIEIESITTNSLIKTSSNIEEWYAPSNSLINNYHEW